MTLGIDGVELDSIGKQAAELLIQLARPRKLWLFGSRARNEGFAWSDYDFALEGPSLESPDRWRISEALEQLRTLRQFDVVWLDMASDALRDEVSKEGICLYER